ncbi:MAG: cysteine--tRNA ligase [Bacteriovoracaceae bacterium]|jgi:cysteinyl-tRNA synthetase|nr:cysteine--tRNA ligase [Bacteriovoracaceae bacterium]
MPTELKIFNNLTRKKEVFTPQDPKNVRYYSCGPTTYNFLHVGNARAAVVGDLFNRVLRALGFGVTFVRNFTDVDDKIIEAAAKRGIGAIEHAAEFVEECKKDYLSLGMMEPDFSPKVSETMPEIISMIEQIIENGFGYVIDGEVFYEVPKKADYGKLSKKKLDDLQHGKRVGVDEKKRNPADFVLWKPAKKGEPSWESPWGAGRPGWHIECSAMNRKILGDTIDLHHGGIDLMFPHHENEIAQSEAANSKQFCLYWAHNEFLNMGSEKMSKSLGNVITIRKFVETYGGQVLRQLLVGVHYRSVMEWTDEVVERAMSDVERIHEFVLELEKAGREGEASEDVISKFEAIKPAMEKDLANDFNVPGALSHFFTMIRDLRREVLTKGTIPENLSVVIGEVINFSNHALGVIDPDPVSVLAGLQSTKKALKGGGKFSDAEIEDLIRQRKQARADKNWSRADELRDIFKENGIVLKDRPDGTTTWGHE